MKTLVIILVCAAGAITYFSFRPQAPAVTTYGDSASISQNVSQDSDRQIILIQAKGGYAPRLTTAKAGVPTILRVETNATFDCSSALRIPALGYSGNLPPSGTTDIEVPAQTAGTTLKALCSMGMYNFSIDFKS